MRVQVGTAPAIGEVMNYAVILKPSGITRATVIAGAFRQVACRSVFQIFPVRLCHFAEAVTPRPFEGGKCTATPQQWNHKRCSVNPPMLDPLKVSFQNRLAKLHLDLRPGKTAPSHPEVRSSPCFSGPCMLAIQHFIRIPPRSSQKPGPRDMVSTCLRLSTWRTRGLSKWVISRVISTLNGVTLIITLLITDLLSPWASK